MEGLHFRKKEVAKNPEEEAEFLDEEEQDKLLKELREQNDTANMHIQIGLVIIGLLVAALFGSVLLQRSSIPTIPIADIFESTPSTLKSPTFAVFCSLTSITLSILTLLGSSRVKMVTIPQFPLRYTGATTIGMGCISPMMCLFSSASSIELFFWAIPLVLAMMYYFAFHMINQVYQGLDELEGSKYKYKGA